MFASRFLLLLALPLALFASGASFAASAKQDHGSGHDHAVAHDDQAVKSEAKISEALATLVEADRKLAESQRFCPIMAYSRLGADGAPIKIELDGQPVFVCCRACIDAAKKDGAETLKTAKKLADASAALAKLPAADRTLAEAQKYCAISNESFLGSMGAPIKLEMKGKPVFLCCQGCVAKAQADSDAVLAKVEELKKAGASHDHGHDGKGHADHDHGGEHASDKR